MQALDYQIHKRLFLLSIGGINSMTGFRSFSLRFDGFFKNIILFTFFQKIIQNYCKSI